MATKTACFKCYQRARRANQHPPDLHTPSLRKDHVKLVKLYSKLMDVLAALKVNDDAKDAIMLQVRPYFRPIAHLVNVGPEGREDTPDDADDAESVALLERIRAVPVVPQITDDEWTPELKAEILACWKRHQDMWNSDDPEEFFRAVELVNHPDNNSEDKTTREHAPAYIARDKVWDDVRAILTKHGITRSMESPEEVLAKHGYSVPPDAKKTPKKSGTKKKKPRTK